MAKINRQSLPKTSDQDSPISTPQDSHNIANTDKPLHSTNCSLTVDKSNQSDAKKLVTAHGQDESSDDGIESATPTNNTSFQYNTVNNNSTVENKETISEGKKMAREQTVLAYDDGFEDNVESSNLSYAGDH